MNLLLSSLLVDASWVTVERFVCPDSKPGGSVNGKVSSDGVSPVHEVQIKPTPAVAVDEQKKTKAKAKAPPVAEVPAKKKEASPPKVSGSSV